MSFFGWVITQLESEEGETRREGASRMKIFFVDEADKPKATVNKSQETFKRSKATSGVR